MYGFKCCTDYILTSANCVLFDSYETNRISIDTMCNDMAYTSYIDNF